MGSVEEYFPFEEDASLKDQHNNAAPSKPQMKTRNNFSRQNNSIVAEPLIDTSTVDEGSKPATPPGYKKPKKPISIASNRTYYPFVTESSRNTGPGAGKSSNYPKAYDPISITTERTYYPFVESVKVAKAKSVSSASSSNGTVTTTSYAGGQLKISQKGKGVASVEKTLDAKNTVGTAESVVGDEEWVLPFGKEEQPTAPAVPGENEPWKRSLTRTPSPASHYVSTHGSRAASRAPSARPIHRSRLVGIRAPIRNNVPGAMGPKSIIRSQRRLDEAPDYSNVRPEDFHTGIQTGVRIPTASCPLPEGHTVPWDAEAHRKALPYRPGALPLLAVLHKKVPPSFRDYGMKPKEIADIFYERFRKVAAVENKKGGLLYGFFKDGEGRERGRGGPDGTDRALGALLRDANEDDQYDQEGFPRRSARGQRYVPPVTDSSPLISTVYRISPSSLQKWRNVTNYKVLLWIVLL